MARIAGVELPTNKKIEYALTYIYGIGHTLSLKLLKLTNVNANVRVKDLSEAEIQRLSNQMKTIMVEGDLKQKIFRDIKRLKDIKSYRGSRHQRGLPSRGQRTKTNSRTRRGNTRKTMGTGRGAVEKK